MYFEELERNAGRWRAVFKDDDESPLVPNTVHWRLDCSTTNQVVRDWTAVAPQYTFDDYGQVTVSYAIINIPSAANAILDSCNPRELKRLIVCTNKDTDGERKDVVSYYVNNLQGVS